MFRCSLCWQFSPYSLVLKTDTMRPTEIETFKHSLIKGKPQEILLQFPLLEQIYTYILEKSVFDSFRHFFLEPPLYLLSVFVASSSLSYRTQEC